MIPPPTFPRNAAERPMTIMAPTNSCPLRRWRAPPFFTDRATAPSTRASPPAATWIGRRPVLALIGQRSVCQRPRSSVRAPFAGRGRARALAPLGFELEQVAGLARERLADRLERREADRPRLAGLEDREVGEGHADPIGELGERHPAIVQEVVELDGDRHVRPSLPGPAA